MAFEGMITKLGLTVPQQPTLPEGLRPAAWGQSGNTWAFWFHNPTAEGLLAELERVRTFVNAQYRVPKALRFVSPYMVVVAVLDKPDPAVDEAVRTSRSNGPWGGEVFHLVSATRSTGAVIRLTPRGTRNQRYIEEIRLRKNPEMYGQAAISAR